MAKITVNAAKGTCDIAGIPLRKGKVSESGKSEVFFSTGKSGIDLGMSTSDGRPIRLIGTILAPTGGNSAAREPFAGF